MVGAIDLLAVGGGHATWVDLRHRGRGLRHGPPLWGGGGGGGGRPKPWVEG